MKESTKRIISQLKSSQQRVHRLEKSLIESIDFNIIPIIYDGTVTTPFENLSEARKDMGEQAFLSMVSSVDEFKENSYIIFFGLVWFLSVEEIENYKDIAFYVAEEKLIQFKDGTSKVATSEIITMSLNESMYEYGSAKDALLNILLEDKRLARKYFR